MLLLAVIGPLIFAAHPAWAASSDPYCTHSYGGAPPRAGTPLRFGVDPGLAGSAGGAQLPAAPDDPAKDLAGVRRLVPPGRQLVVRLNRLFWSGGQAGINALAGTLYPTYMRSTGTGWAFGIGRFGSIMGPVIGGQLIALALPLGTLFATAAAFAQSTSDGSVSVPSALSLAAAERPCEKIYASRGCRRSLERERAPPLANSRPRERPASAPHSPVPQAPARRPD